MKKLASLALVATLLSGCGLSATQTKSVADVSEKFACIASQLVFTDKAADIAKYCAIADELLPIVEQVIASQKAGIAADRAAHVGSAVCQDAGAR